MIQITIDTNKIIIQGHAGYAEIGKDIVCAGISTLAYNLENSIERLTNNDVSFFYADNGNIEIEWKNLDAFGYLLFSSFILGAEMISNSYPDNVTVQTLNTLKAME